MPRTIRHIVVIRFSAMGDVAMTVPVVAALSRRYPELKITMVSKPLFRPLFDGFHNVDFLAADIKMENRGARGLIKLFWKLIALHADAFADLHNVLRSKVLTWLFNVAGRETAIIDKGRTEKRALTRVEGKIFKQLRTGIERYADVFDKLGLPVDLKDYEFPPRPDLTEKIQSLSGKREGKWIGIAPFAQHQGKIYPDDLISEVIAGLASDQNNMLFLFGGNNDEKQKLSSFAKNPNVIVVAGKLSFADELILIRNLDVMLSMDSANAHLAAIYGVSTVTLWGATHPYAGFAPFRQPPENMLLADRQKFPALPTSVYGNKVVPGYEDAMRTIAPADVINKVKDVLA